jgi:hypothetical protein
VVREVEEYLRYNNRWEEMREYTRDAPLTSETVGRAFLRIARKPTIPPPSWSQPGAQDTRTRRAAEEQSPIGSSDRSEFAPTEYRTERVNTEVSPSSRQRCGRYRERGRRKGGSG